MRKGCARRLFLASVVLGSIALAQVGIPGAPPPAKPEPPADPLGRGTPRGTVIGFLTASRKGDYEIAQRYLDTSLRGSRADSLSRQLAAVLDRRLPAKINDLSARPEGSQYDPDRPDSDLVGRIDSLQGPVDVLVQRVNRGKSGAVWLFSKDTLDAIPALYEEVNHVSVEDIVPAFLTEHKIAQIPLVQWLLVLLGMPFVYVLTGLLDRLLSPVAARAWRRIRGQPAPTRLHFVPQPVRLLLLVLVIRWMMVSLNLSLLTRLFWSSVATVLAIVASVWLVLMLNAWGWDYTSRRLERRGVQGAVSILRLVRRTVDILVLFGGALILLSFFNLNVTAALAGLGVGGIAIALAAQKTLENVIGGISIIADGVVRVGDVLKIGDTTGSVEAVGLRSTRLRTMDRSVVSIPNGQISNERLEDLSCRDKFWLHPILSLRYETTAAQMRSALVAIRRLLIEDARVEKSSVRVRFLRFGSSSLDVEVFAYISVIDFAYFLEIQEELLLRMMDAIQAAGTRMALPSQTTYLNRGSAYDESAVPEMVKIRNQL